MGGQLFLIDISEEIIMLWLLYFFCERMEKGLNKFDDLKDFNSRNSCDASYDIYKNFLNSDEELKEYGKRFSVFYYIPCYVPYDDVEWCEDNLDNLDDWDNSLDDWDAVYEQGLKVVKKWNDNIRHWKDFPGIYDILKKHSYSMAEGRPIEILVCKYSDEYMEKARKVTEEKRKEYEWTWIIVRDPNSYAYFPWCFGGSTWRGNQEVIRKIRNIFPDKVKEMKLDVVRKNNKKEGD